MVLYFFIPQFCAYISARNWVETSYDTDFVGKNHSTLVLLYYVQYSYEVNNRKFFSKRCNLSRDYVSTPDYSDGMKTICYVNPNDPNDAVLNRNFPFANLTPIIFGLLLFIIGAGSLISDVLKDRNTLRLRNLLPHQEDEVK